MHTMRLSMFTVRILYTQIMYSNVCVCVYIYKNASVSSGHRRIFFPRYGKTKKKKKNRTTTDVFTCRGSSYIHLI